MMDEIASHIMDIVANSVSAKANNIIVAITNRYKEGAAYITNQR